MCGIVGLFSESLLNNADQIRTVLTVMGDAITHRGPDDEGIWFDAADSIGFSHRRLSVLDLSPAGHQPMESRCGRFVIVYNGEIYNHQVIRGELEKDRLPPRFAFRNDDRGEVWHGHSDTETLLAAIEAWGVDEALKRVKGMFAFALWDKQQKALYLARDRVGEKPLYYGWQGDTFLFGSELKALKVHPDFKGEIDRGALALFLRHNYVPGPYSIYKGIKKLPEGTFLKIETGGDAVIQKGQEKPEPYWDFAQVAKGGLKNPFAGSEADALSALDQTLGSAVEDQMLADVPLGALLSGGVDSSLICSLMQSRSTSRVKTFTIGFDSATYNEATFAAKVAKHLGTEHTELYLNPNDALELVPSLPEMYDEPFADSSQLPTHLVMKLVKQHVTVALSGDGGDELFAGYNRYTYAPKVWDKLGGLPQMLRDGVAKSLTAIPAITINRLANSFGVAQAGDKAHKLGQRLANVASIDDLYISLVSEWGDVSDLVIDAPELPYLLNDRDRWPAIDDSAARMMALDTLSYLPDDILVKVDRAAMAVSLETRAPFLDKEVVAFAWQLPMNFKLRDGQGKWILRQLLYKHVPQKLVERPKMGFSIPLDDWLRGPLREWAEPLLDENRLISEGLINPEPVRRAWQQHQQGKANFGYRLWSVLMFQAWLEHQQSNL
jgi:asparagine synthase (glutamine-hydrolysing)